MRLSEDNPSRAEAIASGLNAGAKQTAPSEPDFDKWYQDLDAFLSSTNYLIAGGASALTEPVCRLGHKEVFITFCGHFKAGKSTLLNAALRRPLLPMDQLPETGTICRMRSGTEESALLSTGNGFKVVPCTTEIIRRYSSLVDEQGDRRTSGELARELELTLKHSIIPNKVWWPDSPGINDQDTMTERAFVGAIQADVLIWVINSRAPSSEVEDAFIQRISRTHGPAAVVFIFNAFLPEQSRAAWLDFKERLEPALATRLLDHREAMGLGKEVKPRHISACAKAIVDGHATEFGAAEFARFMAGLNSPSHPRVRHTRMHRVHAALNTVMEKIRAEITAIQRQNEAWLAEAAAQKSREKKRRASFGGFINAALEEALTDWRGQARRCGERVIDEIESPLVRDDTYERSLNHKLKYGSQNAADELLDKLNVEAEDQGFEKFDPEAVGGLYGLWFKKKFTVTVPDNSVAGTTVAKGAAAGAALAGIFSFGLLTIPGAIVGAAFSASSGSKKAKELDEQQTKENVRSAASEAFAFTKANRAKILDCLEAAFQSTDDHESTKPPGAELEKKLRSLERTALHLVETGNSLLKLPYD